MASASDLEQKIKTKKSALLLIFAFEVLSACAAPSGQDSTEKTARAPETLATFVDSRLCLECHQDQYESWVGSHHDLAMQEADETAVLGDFSGVEFTRHGVTSRFYKDGAKFMVRTEGPNGAMSDYKIQYTFGVEPLQQYLIEFPGGRLQCLTVAWDTKDDRWFHLYPNDDYEPGEPMHWTGRYQNWNLMCAECHSTDLQKNYNFAKDEYQTTWHEIDVGCQACHGPGSAHVESARSAKKEGREYSGDPGLLVNFQANDSRYQIEACAPCHSRRHNVTQAYQHGQPYLDHHVPQLLSEGYYHSDGQILEEVYVYGSFLQSKMYREGVRCTDCHDAHSLKIKFSGNAACVQCHSLNPPLDRFPTLTKKNYDTPEHHHHPEDSPGAACVNCHMPESVYMVVDPRRDHSIAVPRPDLSVDLDTPNACNGCHEEQSAKWAADRVGEWFGSERTHGPRFAEAFAAGRAGRPEALRDLTVIARDLKQGAIIRATALDLLPQYGPNGMKVVAEALKDPEPLVRVAAASGTDRMEPAAKLAAVAPLLTDPVRAVRIEAARVLALVPGELLNSNQQALFKSALEEYKTAQMSVADMPSSHLNLAVVQEALGDSEKAEESYKTVLRMDPTFLPAHFNLSTLYNQMGRNREAEVVLREGLEQYPEEGELYYSLGLLNAEENRLDEAAGLLSQAADLLPQRARVRYNLGLTLQHLGRRKDAERELRKAHLTDPTDAGIVQAVTIFYVQQEDWETALHYAKKLVELSPGQPGPLQLLSQINDQSRR